MKYSRKKYFEDYERARQEGIRSATKFPMSDTQINKHLLGKNPLAIFARGDRSRYFGLDVDSEEKAEGHTLRLLNVLEAEGIDRDYINVSFSGSKGYHIELFIYGFINIKHWDIFARYIIDRADLTGEAIEWRPTKTNGQAWKLPLTIHMKTGAFAGFCDKNTLEVYGPQASHDYLTRIQKMDPNIVVPIINNKRKYVQQIEWEQEKQRRRQVREKADKRKAVRITRTELFKTVDEKREEAEKLLNEGLPGTKTRWRKLRDVLIPYLKMERGFDQESMRDLLINWTVREIDEGRAETPLDECINEIDELLLYYYPQIDGFYVKVREVEISREELDWVLGVVKYGGRRTARDLLWSLMLLKKAFAKNDGSFFASREMLQKLLSKPKKIGPGTIQRQRKWLSEQEYIEYHVPKNFYYERKATEYRLLFEPSEDPEIIDVVPFDEEDTDARKLLQEIAGKLYDEKTFKLYQIA